MVEKRSASPLVDPHSVMQEMAPRAGGQTDEEDSNPQAAPKTRVKRARKQPRESEDDARPSKKSRRRGRLDLMPTMNLDILFHILCFLYPMDLLNLSRTTKDFRNLLLQPSSATAWKTARLQVEGLPDCPPDMSEPQYANLLFYPHCHDCDRVVRNVAWAFRARYCAKCFDSNTLDQYGRGSRGRVSTDFSFRNYLPSVVTLERGRSKPLFLRKALEELLVEYSKTPQDERTALLRKKQVLVLDVMRHAKKCERWLLSVASSRKDELDEVRRKRKDAIIVRLNEAGYKSELDYVGISWLQQQAKALFRAKALTSKEWDRIRPDLIAKLNPFRVRRLEDEIYGPRREILMVEYKKYLQQPPPPGAAFDLMPHAPDIAEFAPFRNIITSPESTTITASSFISAFQELPHFIPSWRAKIDDGFMDQIHVPETDGDRGKQRGSDILQLATAAFRMRCDRDHRLLMYPEVLSWPGFFSSSRFDLSDDFMTVPELRMKQFGCQTWSASWDRCPYVVKISVFEGAAAVVRATGFDLRTARREDMDRLDARLACGSCSSQGRKVIMRWDMAVIHSYRLHGYEEVSWTLIEGDDLVNVKNHERETKPHAPHKSTMAYCALCQHHIGDVRPLQHILDHLTTIHGIPSDMAEQGIHFIPDCNSISVIAMCLESEGKVSKHVDTQTATFCNGTELLRGASHFV